MGFKVALKMSHFKIDLYYTLDQPVNYRVSSQSLAHGAGIDESNTSSILSRAIDQVSSTATWWEIGHFSPIIGVEIFPGYSNLEFCSHHYSGPVCPGLGYERIQSDAKHPSPC